MTPDRSNPPISADESHEAQDSRDQQRVSAFVLCSERIVTRADGTVLGRDAEAIRLIQVLDLNSPRLIEWRTLWMRIIELAAAHNPELHRELVGFPQDMPQLDRLRPPGGNDRPDGIAESWHMRKARGELPPQY